MGDVKFGRFRLPEWKIQRIDKLLKEGEEGATIARRLGIGPSVVGKRKKELIANGELNGLRKDSD